MIPRCPAPDPAHVYHQRIIYCAQCNFAVENEMAKLDTRVFHPGCFVCAQCKESLVGKKVHIYKGENYDEACFSNMQTICDICKNAIAGENETYVKSKGQNFHYECYVCFQCKCSLKGKRYCQDGPNRLCQACVAANRFVHPPASTVGEEL